MVFLPSHYYVDKVYQLKLIVLTTIDFEVVLIISGIR